MSVAECKEAGLFQLPSLFKGIRLVRSGDPDFPGNLAQLQEYPEKLFYRGALKGPDALAVAVVGSRASSELGEKRAYRLSYELAQAGVTVVSGLAQGIDGAAHRGALAAGSRTVAVLGTGLNQVRPYQHRDLGKAIVQSGGALFSEFFPEFTGYRSGANYLKRNTIVAGLSQVLVVVEAQFQGGTADTIKKALHCGRSVGLLRSLVESQPWAAQLAEVPEVFVVDSTADVLERLI